MSDTSGASDLDNDMPGIGAASGNARGAPSGLPSALQGLVQHFQTLMGGMGGNQQPPPPRQRQPPIRLESTDPPDPTARSFAPLPANAPQPPSSFTPFMRNIPRDSSQWGQPEAFPRLPQTFELPGMMSQIGNYFAQYGTAASRPVGAGLSAYQKSYDEAYQKGMEHKMRMAMDQIKLHRDQLEELEERRAIEYGDVWAKHAEIGDSAGIHDDLWRKAIELGDNDVIQMLERGASAEQVRRFMADHEARLRDLKAANAKSDQQDAEDAKRWGLDTPDTSGGDPWQTGRTTPTGATPGATPAPNQVAGPGAPPPQPGTTPAPIDSPVLKPYEQVGLDIARGRPATGLPKKVADAAQEYASTVDNRMDNVVAHSAGKTQDQIAQELTGISPSIAADWNKLLNGKVGLPGGMGAVGARPYWSNLADLALAVKPSWSAKDFERIGELNKEYDAGPLGRRMSRTESMAAAGRTLLEALHEIPEGSKPAPDAIEAWLNHTFTGDPKWGRVFSAYHTYVQEAQTIASQSGNFHEGDVQRVLRETPYTSGPEFIRGSTLLVDAQNSIDTMAQLNDDYKNVVGRDALHYNPNALATLRTIASYDPKTHQFRDVLDPTLKGLDRSYDAQQPKGPSGQPGDPPSRAPSAGWGPLQ
jgi:hypothetical protein